MSNCASSAGACSGKGRRRSTSPSADGSFDAWLRTRHDSHIVRGAVQLPAVAAALLAALVFTAGAVGVGGPPPAVSPAAIAAGGNDSCVVTVIDGVRCWGQGYGAKPLDITGLSDGASTIAVGAHSCVVTK